ncbi:DUF421 domain-containing protein [Bacillus salacetis]|uniref:DUF421 domain-containing protein n=1 Tax=Bacillus salacetis TaxID=2315464 RepID=A0A3A1R4J2_9BACI|nr:DUF421 domain-containing protein [Bacillus salacetis]RIW37665.1 DUF421 domain-containing protein [Bacillus salacetis]
MNEFLVIILRTIFLYAVILFIFRVMGKREIGELSLLDLVVFIMIAEMAVLAIEEPGSQLVNTLLPMGVLFLIQIGTAFLSLKSKKFREIVDGKPTVLISHGKIDEKAMKRQRYNFDDLLLQLREKDVSNLADVEFAILEPSGTLSVIKKDKKGEGSLTLPLILDGIIQKNHLDMLGKNEFWLRKRLREQNYHNLENISFCSFQNGQFYIDLRDQ